MTHHACSDFCADPPACTLAWFPSPCICQVTVAPAGAAVLTTQHTEAPRTTRHRAEDR